jgi:probable HAF family extracellular repeat protein
MMSLGNPWSEASFGESFLGTPAGIESTFGTAINTAGEVAGYASGLYYSWWAGDAVYYDYAFVSGGANGIYTPLSNPLYGDTFAYDINDLGQVAGALGGITATVWQDGVFTDLHVQTGVNLNVANAINNAGQIVANGWNSQGQPHAFLLTRAVILRISNVTVAEGNTGTVSAVFSVSLSEPVAEVVTVSYSTADGTASDSDYQAVAGTLTFAPGETSKTVTVLVNGDRLGEPNETFVVNLSGATNATIADDQGVGTIFDDEPRISISDVSRKEGKRNQTTLFTFTVTLSAAYDQPVTMSFRTVNDTANTSNNDYVARSGTVTFAPGETTRTITVEVKGDSKGEADETFFLDLFGLSSNALFTRNRGLGTILNDD